VTIEIDKLRSTLQELSPNRQAVLVPFLAEAVERFSKAANEVRLADIEAADFIRLFFAVELRVGEASAERSVSRGRFYETHPR